MRKVRTGEERTWIVQALVLAIQCLDVSGNNLVLVRWTREIVAESTARSIETVGLSIESNTRLTESCNFRLKLLGSSNSRDIRARGRESGEESARVLSIIGETCGVVLTSKSTITAGNQERSTTSTDLSELLANTLSVGFWNSLLVIYVRCADYVGDLL